jgi:hypothetical protein
VGSKPIRPVSVRPITLFSNQTAQYNLITSNNRSDPHAKNTATLLKGSERRKYMAYVVKIIGYGGQQ